MQNTLHSSYIYRIELDNLSHALHSTALHLHAQSNQDRSLTHRLLLLLIDERLTLNDKSINLPVVRTPAKTQHCSDRPPARTRDTQWQADRHIDSSSNERKSQHVINGISQRNLEWGDELAWPYLTGLRFSRYSSRIRTLPVQAEGAVPSSYLPDQLPCRTPSSSREFT